MNGSWQRIGKIALASAAVGAFMVTALPEADAGRRASLAQNRLIMDRNDVYLFPQVGVEYANLVALDYGTASSSGSGLLLLGNESMAFGVGVFRGDALSSDFFPYNLGHQNLGQINNPLGGFPQPLTVVDLFGSLDLGAGLAGARLSFGNGGNRTLNIQDEETGASQTFVNAVLGYSLLGDLRVDTGLTLRFASAGSVAGDVDQTSGSNLFAGLSARGYSALASALDLGFLVDVAFGTETNTNLADPDDSDSEDIGSNTNNLLLAAGVGPVYAVTEGTTIAAYGVLGFSRSTTDPDTRDGDDSQFDRTFTTDTVLPGVHLAADIQLLDWLYFRTGLQYNFTTTSTVSEVDTDGIDDAERDDTVVSSRGDDFGWRAGVGIEIENFSLDGTFEQGFLLNGPAFIGGGSTGLFTMLSASYRF